MPAVLKTNTIANLYQQLMLKLGNEKTNKVFEAKILSGAEQRWVSVNSDR
jgi:hypothetical protein